MRTTILHELIAASDQLNVPPAAREQFKRLILQLGIKHGVGGMAHVAQVDFARRLLAARVSRPTIRERLMAMYDISRSQAYAVISEALA